MSVSSHFGEIFWSVERVIEIILKSTALMIAAGFVAFCMRRSAAARHLVWTVALLGSLSLPLLAFVTPSWEFAALPVIPKYEKPISFPFASKPDLVPEPDATKTAAPVALSPIIGSPADFSIFSSSALSPPNVARGWKATLVFVWLAGCFTLLFRNLIGLTQLHQLARTAHLTTSEQCLQLTHDVAESLGVRRHVRLLESEQTTVPITWGVLKPVILLPSAAKNWPPEWRRLSLLHELAHVKRLDSLTQILAAFACALHWFNPLVWFAAHRMRIERELACDDEVVANGARPSEYAQTLLDIARTVGVGPSLPSMAVGLTHSDLERRIRAIVDPTVNRTIFRRKFLMLPAVFLLGVNLTLAPLQLVAAEPDARSSLSLIEPQSPQKSSPPAPEKAPEPETEDESNEEAEMEDPIDPSDKPQKQSQVEESSTNQDLKTEFQDFPYTPTPKQELLMKIHGVTPEFVESFRQLGYPRLPIYQLLGMAKHKIDTNYIREVEALGYDDIWIGDLIYIKTIEISLEELKRIKEESPENSSLRKIISPHRLALFGLSKRNLIRLSSKSSPRNESEFRAYFKTLADLKKEETENDPLASLARGEWELLKNMRDAGVTENYVESLQSVGYDKLLAEDFIKLRDYGVTREYILELRQKGLNNLTVDQLIQMKIDSVAAK